MATPKQFRRRGRWTLIIGTLLAALTFGAVMAFASSSTVRHHRSTGRTRPRTGTEQHGLSDVWRLRPDGMIHAHRAGLSDPDASGRVRVLHSSATRPHPATLHDNADIDDSTRPDGSDDSMSKQIVTRATSMGDADSVVGHTAALRIGDATSRLATGAADARRSRRSRQTLPVTGGRRVTRSSDTAHLTGGVHAAVRFGRDRSRSRCTAPATTPARRRSIRTPSM